MGNHIARATQYIFCVMLRLGELLNQCVRGVVVEYVYGCKETLGAS